MKTRMLMTLFVVIGIAVLGVVATASADSIIPSAPTVTPLGGGLFSWAYTLSIDSAQLIPVNTGSQPCTTTGSLGLSTQCSFFTFFDVLGLSGSPTFSSGVAGLSGSVTTPNSGPVAFNSSVPDKSSIPNVDVAFTNASGSPISGTALGTLTFDSTLGASGFGFFSGQADLVTDGHLAAGNQGQVLTPAPEPASLALFGPGVLGLVGVMTRRRRVRHA